jgi:hypothetical protein
VTFGRIAAVNFFALSFDGVVARNWPAQSSVLHIFDERFSPSFVGLSSERLAATAQVAQG